MGTIVGHGRPIGEIAGEIADLETVGLDSATFSEAYTFDAVSQLGYLAARTRTIELATGILSVYARTPTTTAMTAAGLDYVSDGRFRLGIGASGPQVVEGFHGVRYDAPLARTREVIDICRQVWRRDKLVHAGKHYQVPLPAGLGTGEGKPLKLINRPVRDRIPITVAAIGPANVELAAELAEGWEPIFFHPGAARQVWGAALDAGAARRDPALGSLDVVVRLPLAVGEDTEPLLPQVRAKLALYIGGMGSRGHNFYNDLAVRYGYPEAAEKIQDLFLAGRMAEAAAAVPDDLVAATALVGTVDQLRERVTALRAAGVTLLNVEPLAAEHTRRVEDVAALRDLLDAHAHVPAVPAQS
ncbi:LLM class F420-dependent oxidoreductase [Nakamurella sp. YIM 132087]|uniref:LLM class F420-dependent oxidoreductase n=1 Tax=Nakamurella alba TaxID=2665158 RepID=A0A7K1FJE1_9ACTN|nr:LLM class F420-dependent oxidoreductase [Nakamurella alba]